MDEKDMKQIEGMLNRAVGVIIEDAQHKFEILTEGHKMLAEKLDRTDSRFDRMDSRLDRVEVNLGSKIDAVAADLTAHRCDTEAHQKGWQVREE